MWTCKSSRWLPAALALGLVAAAAPAARAADDIGRQYEQEYGIVDRNSSEGRRLNDQLDRVVRRVVGAINDQPGRAGFRLRSARLLGGRDAKHDKVINAFALPDGRIYVMLGLMRALENAADADDELAFVVGHEVTHVVEKHSKNQQKQALKYGLAAILLGAVTRNEAVGQIAGLGANAKISHYGRNDEYAADRGGLTAMNDAGYDPQSSIRMLNRLKQAGEEDNRTINGWFGSHPLTANRIDRIREMIANLRSGRRIDSDSNSGNSNDRINQYDRNYNDRRR